MEETESYSFEPLLLFYAEPEESLERTRTLTWNDFKIAVPAFPTLAIMPFTYNISYGIAFGLISYLVISVFCGVSRISRGAHGSLAHGSFQKRFAFFDCKGGLYDRTHGAE